MEAFRRFALVANNENRPPEQVRREETPEYINGVRPTMFAMAALTFHLVPPGTFLFLDDDENVVTALLYYQETQDYLCVIYQQHGRYTHYRHIPANLALRQG